MLNDRLAGGQGSLTSDRAVKTIGSYWPYATTIFDYVRRAMPYVQPHSLTNDEAYALTAHLLHINGIIGPNDVIDARTLPAIEMPNLENFVWNNLQHPEGTAEASTSRSSKGVARERRTPVSTSSTWISSES